MLEKKWPFAVTGLAVVIVLGSLAFFLLSPETDFTDTSEEAASEQAADTSETDASESIDASEDEDEEFSDQWSSVVAGNHHSCGLRKDRTLWCWGENEHGELGVGDDERREESTLIGEARDWTNLSAGSHHTCGIRDGGRLYCWGRNDEGQLGDGTATTRHSPVRVPGEDWTDVDAGTVHTCALDEDGHSYCWGANDRGQLGDDNTPPVKEPVQVSTSQQFQTIAAASYYTCAIDTDAQLWCWGGSTTDHPLETRNGPGKIGEQEEPWAEVVAGDFHTCAITASSAEDAGQLYCWGHDAHGRVADEAAPFEPKPRRVENSEWHQISARAAHTCGIEDGGTASCWGYDPPEQLMGTAAWIDVAVGVHHSCAIDDQHELHCWEQSVPEPDEPPEGDELSDFFVYDNAPDEEAVHWYRLNTDAGEVIQLTTLELENIAGSIEDVIRIEEVGVAILTEETSEFPAPREDDEPDEADETDAIDETKEIDGADEPDDQDDLAMVTVLCRDTTCTRTVRRLFVAAVDDDEFEKLRQLDISAFSGRPDKEELGDPYTLEEGSEVDNAQLRAAKEGIWISNCLVDHYEDECGYHHLLRVKPGPPEAKPGGFTPLPQHSLYRSPDITGAPGTGPQGIELSLEDRTPEDQIHHTNDVFFCLSVTGEATIFDNTYPNIDAVRWLGDDPPIYVRVEDHFGYIGHTEYAVYQACDDEPLYPGSESRSFIELAPDYWMGRTESHTAWHVYRHSERIAELPGGQLIPWYPETADNR